MKPSIKFIAHRGESEVAPENTVEAYALAWRNGAAWGAETDVYLTTDGVLVCNHDGDLNRVAGVDMVLREHTYAEIREHEVGAWKAPQWYGCKTPALWEVYASMPREAHIYVEIKSAGEGFITAHEEARLAGGVDKSQITFISFFIDELKFVKANMPEYRTLLLRWANNVDGTLVPSAADILVELKEYGFDGVDFGCPVGMLTRDYVQEVKDTGFEFHMWTINDLDMALEFTSYGVDSITTDAPARLARELKAR